MRHVGILWQSWPKPVIRRDWDFFTYFTHVLNWRHPYALPNDKLFSARPDYPTPEPRYKYEKEEDHQFLLDDFHALMIELMELPYPVAGLWLDIIKAYYETPQYIPVEKTYAMIREKRPEALISFKQGATGTEDFAAPEHTGNSMGDKLRQEGKPEAAARADKAWEANKSKRNEICSTLQDKGWGYNSESSHMSADKAWGLLAYADSINCNLLLNTGPLPDGSIHPG
jgi:alpha-L-fucosidase